MIFLKKSGRVSASLGYEARMYKSDRGWFDSGSRGKTRDIRHQIGAFWTNLFFGVLDSGRDLRLGGDRLILCGIDLVFPEHGKRSLDAELLDPNLARRHGAGVVEDGSLPAEKPPKKSLKS